MFFLGIDHLGKTFFFTIKEILFLSKYCQFLNIFLNIRIGKIINIVYLISRTFLIKYFHQSCKSKFHLSLFRTYSGPITTGWEWEYIVNNGHGNNIDEGEIIDRFDQTFHVGPAIDFRMSFSYLCKWVFDCFLFQANIFECW